MYGYLSESINFNNDTTFSHDTNFKQLLPLAVSMGYKIPELVFYLMQPKTMVMGDKLSYEVEQGYEKMYLALVDELNEEKN